MVYPLAKDPPVAPDPVTESTEKVRPLPEMSSESVMTAVSLFTFPDDSTVALADAVVVSSMSTSGN